MTTQSPVLICTGEDNDGCGRKMRRRGVKLKDAPDTVAIGHSGKCKSCCSTYEPVAKDEKKTPTSAKAEDPERMSQTVSDLQAWMRRNRKAAPEANNPIRYRREQGAA